MMTKDGLIFEANSLKQGRLQALTRQQLQAQATQNRERRWVPVPVPWHPIPPLLFLVPTAVLLALMAMNKPKHAGIGLAVVLLGLPVYHLVFTRLAPREAPGDASGLAGSSPASPAVETT